MALFRRLKTPFVEDLPDGEAALPSGPQSAGDLLRQQREALRLGLDDVAAALRIKPDYLAALEAGRPDLLPGPAYAIGFLRTYSDYLSLDGGEILRRFKAESAGLDAKPDLAFPMPLGERSIPGGGTLLVALILVFCGYGTWYYLSTVERSRPQRVAELPSELLPLISGQRTGEPTTPPLAQAAADTQPVAAPGAEFSVPTPTNSGLGSTGEPVSAPPVPPPAQAPASAVSTLPPAPPPILVGLAPAAPGEGTRGNEIVDAPVRIVIRATPIAGCESETSMGPYFSTMC
jgi:cytoskeleton protein RodZ